MCLGSSKISAPVRQDPQDLYYNGNVKLSTTNTGIGITGGLTTSASSSIAGANVTADFAWSDNIKANFGASNDLQIYHDASNSYIRDAGTGNLYIDATSSIIFRE